MVRPDRNTRERTGKARAELQRRGQQPSAGGTAEPQDITVWWPYFQVHADAVDRAIVREHQASIREGQTWPPERKPEAGHEESDVATPELESQPRQFRPAIPEASTEHESSALEPGTPEFEVAGPVPAGDRYAARLDELQACADEAKRRIDAQRAQLDMRTKYTARIERGALGEPEADRQADTSYEIDR